MTQTLQIAPVIFFGRGIFQYSFGMLPKRMPITVVGKDKIQDFAIHNVFQ